MRFLINAQEWLLIITTVAGVLIALIGSVEVMRHILRDAKKGLVDWIIFALLLLACVTLILTIVTSLIKSDVASAAENPVPVESPVVVEKSAASCPTEFNIDDSAWAMREINSVPQKVHELYIERIRIFSYFPNPNCVAKLGSYSSYDFADGKRVWGIIQAPGKNTFFLLQNNNSPLDLKTLLHSKPDVWQSGDRITGIFTCENIKECNITFVLYKENVPIALRKLPLSIE